MNNQTFDTFGHQFVCGNALFGKWELLSAEFTQEHQMDLIRSRLCVYALHPPDIETLKIPENRCLAAKHSDCSPAAVADVVDKRFWQPSDCHAAVSSHDENYCAFCGDQSTRFSDIDRRISAEKCTHSM